MRYRAAWPSAAMRRRGAAGRRRGAVRRRRSCGAPGPPVCMLQRPSFARRKRADAAPVSVRSRGYAAVRLGTAEDGRVVEVGVLEGHIQPLGRLHHDVLAGDVEGLCDGQLTRPLEEGDAGTDDESVAVGGLPDRLLDAGVAGAPDLGAGHEAKRDVAHDGGQHVFFHQVQGAVLPESGVQGHTEG